MDQLRLEFSGKDDLSRENFFASESNRQALSFIELWPKWPSHCLVLAGPESSGKTHLAHIWQSLSRAEFFTTGKDWRSYKNSNVIIDDAGGVDEEVMLHLYNQAKEAGKSLLMTVTEKPSFRLKDLSSRINASPIVHITQPDDELLKNLMIKLFFSRQMAVDAGVIDYVVPRISRSFRAVAEFVAMADSQSLATRRNLTVPLAREILEKLS